MNFIINRKIDTLVTFIIVILGIFSSYILYKYFDETSKMELSQITNAIGSMVDKESLLNLSNNELDLQNHNYTAIKEKLIDARYSIPNIRFISLLGKDGDGIFFIVDSEYSNSKDYSPPGQRYDEASNETDEVFTSKTPNAVYYSDRWGKFFGSNAPIVDRNGKVLAVISIDIVAEKIITNNIAAATIPFFISILILAIFLVIRNALLRKDAKNSDVLKKIEMVEISQKEIEAPLEGIKWEIETLIKTLGENSDQAKAMKIIYDQCIKLIESVNKTLDAFKK